MINFTDSVINHHQPTTSRMSRRVNQKKTEKTVFCKICKDAGEPANICNSHNVRDFKGKVCCPNVVCHKCGMKGSHFDNECVRSQESILKKTDWTRFVSKKETKVAPETKTETASKNIFDGLADSDSESEVACADPPPANVTIRTIKKKPTSWADWDSDDDEDFF